MDSDRTFTFQALRREFGVTSRTLRYYEEQGLLAPERAGQRRVYRPQDRNRLRLVLICRRAGMPLADVRRLLAICAPFEGELAEDFGDVAILRGLIAALAQRRAELGALISELERIRDAMPRPRPRRTNATSREAACAILEFRPRPGGGAAR